MADGHPVEQFPYVASDFVDHQPELDRPFSSATYSTSASHVFLVPYGGKGIYEQKDASDPTGYSYYLSATGVKVPFDPALWDQGQGSNNQGEPGYGLNALAYARWLDANGKPGILKQFLEANPQYA